MALSDVVFPLLNAIDGGLGFLPPLFRVCLWGVVCGIGSMLIYRWLSPQQRIAATNAEIRTTRVELRAASEDLRRSLALSGRQLLLSLRVLRLALGGTVAAGVPVLFVLFWLAGAFGNALPAAGATVAVERAPADAPLVVNGRAVADPAAGAPTIRWPAEGDALRIDDGTATLFDRSVSTAGFAVLHQFRWWNLLVRNPWGYLPESSTLTRITFQFERRRLVQGVPLWLSTWELPFFASLIAASLALRRALAIA
jgi:hypothetical protein